MFNRILLTLELWFAEISQHLPSFKLWYTYSIHSAIFNVFVILVNVAYGQCKQGRFVLNLLKKSDEMCSMVLHNGQAFVFDDWKLTPTSIRVSCECTINKVSPFTQYLNPAIVGWSQSRGTTHVSCDMWCVAKTLKTYAIVLLKYKSIQLTTCCLLDHPWSSYTMANHSNKICKLHFYKTTWYCGEVFLCNFYNFLANDNFYQ